MTQTNIIGLEGRDGMLEAIRWREKSGGEVGCPFDTFSCSSEQTRTQIGCPDRA